MNEFIKKIRNKAELFLENDENHKDKIIDFILINLYTDEAIIFASNEVQIIQFSSISEKNYWIFSRESFNYEKSFFKYLEKNFKVGYVRNELHSNLWSYVQNNQKELKKGIQKYLQFCADYGITKESLNIDIPDIMKYFEGLAFQETMVYKGYIIEADDTNFDNPKEVLVNIYKRQSKFQERRDRIETISLNEIGLKQNIKEYIDENYILVNDDAKKQKKEERER